MLSPCWAEQGLAQGYGTSRGSVWGFGRECVLTEGGEHLLWEQCRGFVHLPPKRSVMFSSNH